MIRVVFIFFSLLCKQYEIRAEDLQLISRSRTVNLEVYESFTDAILMKFLVPEKSSFASFKLMSFEEDLSIFGCSIKNVSLYLKYGSPPVINPDGSKLPKNFKNIQRSKTYNVEFQTDKKHSYINITSPDPGWYYAATFLSYVNPRYRKITQQGVTENCHAFVNAELYVNQINNPTIITENQTVSLNFTDISPKYFTFFAPERFVKTVLTIENWNNSEPLLVHVQAEKIPSNESFLIEKNITDTVQISFLSRPLVWHYVRFDFGKEPQFTNGPNFRINFLTPNNSNLFNEHTELTELQTYNQYDLVRESSTESFLFAFRLQSELDDNSFKPVNVTSVGFNVLKFDVHDISDVGGTLQYIIAFKPRVLKRENVLTYKEEPKEHTVVACIQKDDIPIPIYPNYCKSKDLTRISTTLLNKTTDNSSILIPYPESGTWYASFKLFCGTCKPCNCSEECQKNYQICLSECESTNFNCVESCSNELFKNEDCAGCNCDGGCLRNSSETCNSSIIFDVSSRPCYEDCGRNGKCLLMVSEGVPYSTCNCMNNYRGFDCSDDSFATPYYTVLLEFLLLVLSNLLFIPSSYVAFKRRYYVESLIYLCVFLASTFYHACDAGENIFSFCVFRLYALQFGDFFSALLAIWLTLLAMAKLASTTLSVLQMAGAVLVAFCVTLNRYAFWIFALPSSVGIIIILVSWGMKYRRFKLKFIDRKYLYVSLPFGACLVCSGLIIYGAFQTQYNYKYLHSLWHIVMALGVYFLLPKRDTFQSNIL